MKWFSLLVSLGFSAWAFAAEPTMRELELEIELLKERSARMSAEFERGKLQIEAGTLRQGHAARGMQELGDVEGKVKALYEKLQKLKATSAGPRE